MASRTLLAVSLVGIEPPLAEQIRRARTAGADLVELRVDRIGDIPAVEAVLRAPRELPIILTIRAAREGGAWDGGDDERVALYERLGLLGPEYIDVELATWERSANLRQKIELVAQPRGSESTSRPRARLILSHHDFAGAPADIDAVVGRLDASRAQIIKAVFSAADALDSLRLLDALRKTKNKSPTIALSMGEAGLIPRVLGPKFGAFLVFAALEAGAEAAPGQPTIGQLTQQYRWGRNASTTSVYGVIGWPVAHSRSPEIHNVAMSSAGIDGVYLPLPVRPAYDELARFMEYVFANPWLDIRGFSVTIPHKEHALRWLDSHKFEVTPLARRCGAVNTLTRQKDGRWQGDNTDAPAIQAALHESSIARAPAGQHALILGAGGVARAAAAALLEAKYKVTITNRTPDRAAQLSRALGVATCEWSARASLPADVIINATSVGMSPHTAESPMPANAFRAGQVVLDTVYTPRDTQFLREATAAACVAISGESVFRRQAAAQFFAWHGVEMPQPGQSSV